MDTQNCRGNSIRAAYLGFCMRESKKQNREIFLLFIEDHRGSSYTAGHTTSVIKAVEVLLRNYITKSLLFWRYKKNGCIFLWYILGL